MIVSRQMKYVLLLWAASSSSTALAFTPPPQRFRANPRMLMSVSPFQGSQRYQQWSLQAVDGEGGDAADVFDQKLKDGKLRDAVIYLKQHPNLELSRQRWNDIFDAIQERTANAEENTVNLRELLDTKFPLESEARKEMSDMYDALKEQSQLKLYGAVDTRLPLAAGSHSLPPKLLEEILGMPMSSLTPKATNTLLIAGVAFGIIEILLSFATGISLNFLIITTLLLATVDRLFVNGAVFESILKFFSPGIQEKILRHEAGHFLAAYLLGCPVEGIVLSAWAALQDRRFGPRQVSAGTSFFDPELSHQINSNGQVTRSAVDRYSIIVMAGIAAEADNYGRADGGAGDEIALVAFLSQLNAGKAAGAWNPETIKNQARWGALQAVLMMREYKPAYDALVDALERGGSLGDCIYAIERAARDNNLKPAEPLGFIVDGPAGQTWTTDKPAEEEKEVVEAVQSKPKPFDEQESLAVLEEYKASVEEKLREVERKLKEIDD